MSRVFFPVTFEELSARIEFFEIADESRAGDGYDVKAFSVRHPGGAVGYRFSGGNAEGPSFVYISDNEMGSAERYGLNPDWNRELVEFVRGAKTLIHDATYTAEEYEQHRGWGHSTYREAVSLALDAEVEQLVLFHHRPERTDEELDRRVAECRAFAAERGAHLTIVAAAEGMTLSV